jgi:hypothetical protein
VDPGPADLLVDFLNAEDDEEAAVPSEWRSRPAAKLRAALKQAIETRSAPPERALGIRLSVVLDDAGRPALAADDPLDAVAAAAVSLAVEGRWDRLKLCSMSTCRWAFYDRSRNRSGRWCEMAVCGNRAKTRSFRERHRG